MQTLPKGQFIKHFQYGLGVVTQSNAERTSIDFPLHGPKKFATRLMTVEFTDEAPPANPQPAKRRRAGSTAPVLGSPQQTPKAPVRYLRFQANRSGTRWRTPLRYSIAFRISVSGTVAKVVARSAIP